MKMTIYKSNVRAVLLYRAETWKNNKEIERKIRGEEGRLLKINLKIKLTDTIAVGVKWKERQKTELDGGPW